MSATAESSVTSSETALTASSPALPPALETMAAQARDYARQSKADNTHRAYRADWNDFTAWADSHRLPTLPAAPETVALYLSHLAETHKCSTLNAVFPRSRKPMRPRDMKH